MSLRDWVIGNIALFNKDTILWLQLADGMLHVGEKGEYSFDALLRRNITVEKFYTISTYLRGIKYYLLWDELGCYTVRIDDEETWGDVGDFFVKRVFGSSEWRKVVIQEFGDVFSGCGQCNCYNDKLVTGWCSGKIAGVLIKEGFIWN